MGVSAIGSGPLEGRESATSTCVQAINLALNAA
jgi:hypothetical protein